MGPTTEVNLWRWSTMEAWLNLTIHLQHLRNISWVRACRTVWKHAAAAIRYNTAEILLISHCFRISYLHTLMHCLFSDISPPMTSINLSYYPLYLPWIYPLPIVCNIHKKPSTKSPNCCSVTLDSVHSYKSHSTSVSPFQQIFTAQLSTR